MLADVRAYVCGYVRGVCMCVASYITSLPSMYQFDISENKIRYKKMRKHIMYSCRTKSVTYAISPLFKVAMLFVHTSF